MYSRLSFGNIHAGTDSRAQTAKARFQIGNYYAENCSDEARAYIEKVFDCRVIGYCGHTERAVFAEEHFERGGGQLQQVVWLYGVSPSEYQIACTGFISRKMPLIRYVTDDVITIDNNGYA